MPLVFVATSHRVAPGMLTWRAWEVLRSSAVLTGTAEHPQLPYLREAGVQVEVAGTGNVAELARELIDDERRIVWLADPEGDEDLMRAVGQLLLRDGRTEVEVIHGSYDLPGARLLDLVTTMDILRRECPWDAKQTHESLISHLLEESYEAREAVELGDMRELCEELGDVLLQVAFHARIAEERTDETRFTIDDVAAGIVDKLVRRHPHVFDSVEVADAEEVRDNWAAIKAAERAAKNDGDTGSVLDGVPFGQPALSLAHALQRRAARAGAPTELPQEGIGDRLFELVREARLAGLEPETELRAACRRFLARVQEWEAE